MTSTNDHGCAVTEYSSRMRRKLRNGFHGLLLLNKQCLNIFCGNHLIGFYLHFYGIRSAAFFDRIDRIATSLLSPAPAQLASSVFRMLL
jgi:hypothetical protein